MLSHTIRLYKNAYTGLSKPTWLLSLVMLINRSGTMVIPFMTIYLTSPSMGYSIGQAGIAMAFFGLGAMAGGFIGGRLTDKIGFYPVQVITLAGGAILFVVLGQMKSFPLICFFTFLLSVVNESFRPANSTAIAYYSREQNRTRSYSLNRLAINLGWAVGGALGGIFARINYTLLFWVDGFTNLCAAFLMWYFLRDAARAGSSLDLRPMTDRADSAYRDKKYISFIILVSLFAACFFQMFTTLSAYYKNELHFTEPFIGLLMACNGLLIVMIEMVLIFQLEGKKKNTYYISWGVLLVGISYLMLNIFRINHGMALVGIIVITLGEMLAMPFMNSFWISRSSQHNRGQYAGLYTIAWAIAQTTAPLVGGQIAEHGGFNVLWWLVAATCILVSLGFRLLL